MSKRWTDHPTLQFPVHRYDEHQVLTGFVEHIHVFPDGIVIRFPQNLTESPLKWSQAALWIPNQGTAGILNA